MKIFVIIFLVRAALHVEASKSFGLGMGPSFIGGRDMDDEQTLQIYDLYVSTKLLNGWIYGNQTEEAEYYRKWKQNDQCMGACPKGSICRKGLCICDASQGLVQRYGRCFSTSTADFLGDNEKYRKPRPRSRPQYCFCRQTDGGIGLCDSQKQNPKCQEEVYPNVFMHDMQHCSPGAHTQCLAKDINMVCGTGRQEVMRHGVKNFCECRKDMKFDTKSMECRLFLDIDCTNETADGYKEDSMLPRILTGEEFPDKDYPNAEIKKVFCNLINHDDSPTFEEVMAASAYILGIIFALFYY